jgi:hypothetical protein
MELPSLPVLAIVISTASALFTGINVVVSVKTYRRVRPKVRVHLFRSSVVRVNKSYHLKLRFVNGGSNPVSVERIELVSYDSRRRKGEPKLITGERFDKDLKPGPVVPGLDGVTYSFYVPVSAMSRSRDRHHLRLRVLLSNGRTVRSSKLWFSPW